MTSESSGLSFFMFNISTQQQWAITLVDTGFGTDWVSPVTTSGIGAANIYANVANNTTGSTRTINFVVTYCTSVTQIFTLTQAASKPVIVRPIVINKPEKKVMKLKQSYEYTGSGQFTYDNVLLSSNGIALFDQITGLGGIGYVPYNGSTVTLKAGDPSSEYLDFEPGLNNSIYFLVSDQEYTEKDSATIKSLGTEIPVYFNGTDFEGQFVFNNPNNYENLYLMWDYEDDIGTGTASYNGISKERSIALNLGSDIGIAGISHQVIDEPTRFQIEWGGICNSGHWVYWFKFYGQLQRTYSGRRQ